MKLPNATYSMVNYSLPFYLLAFSALLIGCGPSRDEITAACVEMSETRNMDGAVRVRILRELEVPADDLETVHSSLESQFRRGEGVSGCARYLNGRLGSRPLIDLDVDIENAQPEMVTVAFTDRDISPGLNISESDIKFLTMPRELARQGVITQIDQLDDLVAANEIESGEILLTSMLIPKTDGGRDSVSSQTARRTRAMTFRLHANSGTGNLLMTKEATNPGEKVTLVAIEGDLNPTPTTISSSAKILAADRRSTSPPSDLLTIGSITLELTGQELERAEELMAVDTVRFSLR